jgi:hypothetical protein
MDKLDTVIKMKFDRETRDKITEIAKKETRSQQDQIRYILRKFVQDYENNE